MIYIRDIINNRPKNDLNLEKSDSFSLSDSFEGFTLKTLERI